MKIAPFAVLFVFAALPALAGPPIGSGSCECRFNSQTFRDGDTACLAMPGGTQLVQCEKNLNVMSWRKIQDGCPQSNLARATITPRG
jgi:hypothetical protein